MLIGLKLKKIIALQRKEKSEMTELLYLSQHSVLVTVQSKSNWISHFYQIWLSDLVIKFGYYVADVSVVSFSHSLIVIVIWLVISVLVALLPILALQLGASQHWFTYHTDRCGREQKWLRQKGIQSYKFKCNWIRLISMTSLYLL